MNRLFLGRLACLLALVPGSAYSATYYTAKTGSDSNTCVEAQNESTSKLTIAAGIGCLGSGDALIVKTGVYTDDFIVNVPSGTSWANATTIKAKPGDTVQISASSSSPLSPSQRTVYLGNGKSYIVIDGFILGNNSDNQRYTYDNVKIDGSSHHIRIQNCEIRFSHHQGILVANTSPYTGGHEFLNNDIHDNGASNRDNQVHGIYFSGGSNSKIWNNDFYNNQSYDIHLWGDGADADIKNSNNDIQYNKTRDSKVRGGVIVRGTNNLIANNLVWDSADTGIYIIGGGSGNMVYNNTVYGNRGRGILSTSSTIVRNNISFSNGTNISGGGTQSNNLTTDPSFVNAAADNFRIQSASPARDSGVTLSNISDDFDKVPRPQAAGFDIGAFEYTTGSPPPVASVPEPPLGFQAD